ncbi:MAG: beta-glucuronidase [Actinomycetaceae bacterium]|nr:beta-glucuronidase [Actinomycetaceae bacterium]
MLSVRQTVSRTNVSLDGIWDFKLDPDNVGQSERWFAGPLKDARPMPVPASYNDITTDLDVHDHVGWVWYQRRVCIPADFSGKRAILRFGSATHRAIVWVGETEVARHEGGYLPFEADITDEAGAGTSVLVTVAVDNTLSWQTIPPGFTYHDEITGVLKQKYYHDFFNYAGLHRSVVLYSRPVVAVEDITVVTTIDGADGLVDYRVELTGGSAAEGVDVSVSLLAACGTEVASGTGASGQLRVKDAHFWGPGDGYLYTLVVRAGDDVYPLSVGIRTVEVTGGELLINGKSVYLRGYGRHEDNTVRGKQHDPVMMAHDFELMRWQGANSFRTSHYPYDEAVMDYADRMGFMVIDETAAVGINVGIDGGVFGGPNKPLKTFSPETVNDATREVHKAHIEELIARDKNHPCVIIWSIANEPESFTDASREYFEPLVAATRAADPTRPVGYVNVMLSTPETERCQDMFDVVMLNRYNGWYVQTGDLVAAEKALESELEKIIAMHPTQPVIYTEYGPDTMPGNHDYFRRPWSEEFQTDMMAMYHRVFDRHPQVIGEQMWNFADFMTISGIMRVGGNKKGMFTRDRKPKQNAYAVRDRWVKMRDDLGH